MIGRREVIGGAVALGGLGAAAAGEAVRVVLDWLPNANHAALGAAQACGAFGKADLAVELIAPTDPDVPVRLVAAGQADLAVGYGDQINLADAAGLDVVRIATLIDTPLNTVMALAGRGIVSLGDLRGKQIGVSVGGVEEAVLRVMLGSAGVAMADVTVVRIGYDMVGALLAHRLDAAIGAYRNAEVLQVRSLGQTPVVFRPEEHGVPAYDELIVVARRARRADARLARFVTALTEGTAALLRDPGAMWEVFARAHPELATALGRQCWDATMPFIARAPGRLDQARYRAFQAFAVAQGIVGQAVPLERFAVEISA